MAIQQEGVFTHIRAESVDRVTVRFQCRIQVAEVFLRALDTGNHLP